MRYYQFLIRTNNELVGVNATIRLKDYAYESNFAAMNTYMVKKMNNDVTFFAYREEGTKTYAVLSYDEQKDTLQGTFDHIMGILTEIFGIKKVLAEPEEITMFQYIDAYNEGARRDYMIHRSRIIDTANLWAWDYYKNATRDQLLYEFEEYIIPDKKPAETGIYHEAFIKELKRIEENKSNKKESFEGNLVHYVLSARSKEAARDMTSRLMQELYEAGRITSRRMGMVSDVKPGAWMTGNHLEDMIENNYGGVVVFDLSERFGHNPAEYVNMSEYIVELLKRYRNRCLFVFTYNIDSPGYSYMVLPKLAKYVMTVKLTEGKSDRKKAVQYMKTLIENSEYAKYADQAAEYMKTLSGNEFTQSDVFSAFDRFGSWCICKNELQNYDFQTEDSFLLDRDGDGTSSYEKLQKLIGLTAVKKDIDTVIATDLVEKERKKIKGKDYKTETMHMIFAGNPGTAKTTVAKLFAGIAKEKGILKSGAFVECGGNDLNGMIGPYKIREAFIAAKGGVLFIDEAYGIYSDSAVTALLQEMENKRDEVIVILAGYSDRMKDFLKMNEGLKSRVPNWIEFPDYTESELTEILQMMLKERGFTADDDAITEARCIFEKARCLDDFGNGRYVRNFLDKAIKEQSMRLFSGKKGLDKVSQKELFRITKEDICKTEEVTGKEDRKPGTALKELDAMVGLSSVKNVIHRAISKHKFGNMCMEKGLSNDKVSLHMVFTGNPGTAKTTVARLFAEILKDEHILPSGNFVEVGRADLVGPFVGTTAIIVKNKFKEAKGGVLFIDEAYSLCDDRRNSFGDEAINTIVQEMENHRDDVIVIFAGYPEPMKDFLDRNPGMRSRIAFNVAFEDYSVDELCEITKLMLSSKKMHITDAAMNKLKGIYETVHEREDYGNGRFVRQRLEEAELNLADRLMKLAPDELTEERISTIEESDITYTDDADAKTAVKRQFGFAS